jgi:replicative DNA helicase
LKFVGKYVKFVDLEQDMGSFPAPGSAFTGLTPSADFDKPSNFIIRPSRMDDMEDEQPF